MTKITIKAASLEITIDGTKQEASFITAALATLMAHIISAGQGGEFVEDEPDAPAEPAPAPGPAPGPAPAEPVNTAPACPVFNLENLRTFLTGDPRYTSRSYDAIAKHFGISDDVPNGLGFFLNDCVDDGDIKRTTRRRDSMPLYGAA